MSEQEPGSFFVSSLYGRDLNRPLVQLEMITESDEIQMQVTPAKAIEMGMMLIDCAHAALSDGLLMRFLQKFGLESEATGTALATFRDLRDQLATEDKAHDE